MDRILTAFLLFFTGATLAFSQPAAATRGSSQAELFPEKKSIVAGESFTVALQLSHPEGWHSYYLNSGGVEMPPTVQWKLPEGFTVGPIQWPVPVVIDGEFGKSFTYSGSPVFLMEITPPKNLVAGTTITLTADAEWQICKSSCINEEKSFTLSIPVAEVSEIDVTKSSVFQEARKKQALPLSGSVPTAYAEGSNVTLRVEANDSLITPPIDFIPDQPFLFAASAGGKISRDGDVWVIELKRATEDFLGNAIPPGNSFSGILTGPTNIAIPETTISAPPAKPVAWSAYLRILLGMVVGGLILNLMPCVFPVIGLKIMGFVQQSGEDRKKIALHGLTFTGGVLASFGVISGVLFVARAAGTSDVGWGYQLQDPRVVLGLMLLMFVLALNMFGLFELGTSATSVGGSLQTKQGLGGSFFSGVLATVVATPCSAPFLGVAIGAAIALPAIQFFGAFAAMAIGLSLPYLILSAFPKLIDLLPRPGAWMESFKQAMSFLLFATAGYLLWVYAGQIGLENLLAPIFGLSSIAIAAWIYGRWNLPHRPAKTRGTAIVLTLVFAAGGFFLAKPPEKSALVWEIWSPERVDELLAEGKPVYIDFTAQWCATCQVNKKTSYTKEVIALMQQKGIVALKADKTSPNPKIEEELQALGRTAIPVNVLIVPEKEPIITPEILTPGYLKELFSKEIPAR